MNFQTPESGLSSTQLAAMISARRGLIYKTLLATVALTVAVTLILPKTYTASSDVYLDYKGNDPINGRMFSPMMDESYIQTQLDMVKSQAVAERVIEAMDLTRTADYRETVERRGEARAHSQLVKRINDQTMVVTRRSSRVVEVEYAAGNPDEARDFTNAVVRAYIELNQQIASSSARSRREQYNAQLEHLRKEADSLQEKLTSDQQAHADLLGNRLCIRRGLGCRRIDDEHIEVVSQLLHQVAQGRLQQDFQRIRRLRSGAQYAQMREAFGADAGGNRRASGQHGRQAGFVIESEQAVLASRAHVGINQQGAFAHLRKRQRQAGGQIAFAFAFVGADQRHRDSFLIAQANRQFGADLTDGFRLQSERRMGNRQRRVQILAGEQGSGVIELLRQHRLHVLFGQQAQPHGRFAEADVGRVLQLHHMRHLVLRQQSRFDEAGAHFVCCSAAGCGLRSGFLGHRFEY